MGLHVGEATRRDGDWFGSDVNRAARVMAMANGQQIPCTGAVEFIAATLDRLIAEHGHI
jgi:class 3 adenylate cyclase